MLHFFSFFSTNNQLYTTIDSSLSLDTAASILTGK